MDVQEQWQQTREFFPQDAFSPDAVESPIPDQLRRLSDCKRKLDYLGRLFEIGIDFSKTADACIAHAAPGEITRGSFLSKKRRGTKMFPDKARFAAGFGDPVAAWPLAILDNIGAAGFTRKLLETGVDPNLPLPNSRSLLMVAAAHGNIRACRLLIEAGADPRPPAGSLGDAFDMRLKDMVRNGFGASQYGSGPRRLAGKLSDLWETLVRGPGVRSEDDALWLRVMNHGLIAARAFQPEMLKAFARHPDELAVSRTDHRLTNILHVTLDELMPTGARTAIARISLAEACGELSSFYGDMVRSNARALGSESIGTLWNAALSAGADPLTKDREGLDVITKLSLMGLQGTEAYARCEAAVLDRSRAATTGVGKPRRHRDQQSLEAGL